MKSLFCGMDFNSSWLQDVKMGITNRTVKKWPTLYVCCREDFSDLFQNIGLFATNPPTSKKTRHDLWKKTHYNVCGAEQISVTSNFLSPYFKIMDFFCHKSSHFISKESGSPDKVAPAMAWSLETPENNGRVSCLQIVPTWVGCWWKRKRNNNATSTMASIHVLGCFIFLVYTVCLLESVWFLVLKTWLIRVDILYCSKSFFMR